MSCPYSQQTTSLSSHQARIRQLSKEEILKYHKEASEAKLAELRRWQDLNYFRRSSRSESKNRVDGTWVLKWKK
eukprot:12918471-Prorocentrum_lima.AAC.1